MPFVERQGVRLHYDAQGEGKALLFAHEFAGDARSWEPQVRVFCRSRRCITYNARGYPPSSVPESDADYGVQAAVNDIEAVLDAAGTSDAVVVGASMGGYAALQFALEQPSRVRGLLLCGVGGGSKPSLHEAHRQRSLRNAERFLLQGIATAGREYANAGSRRLLKRKDPCAFVDFEHRCMELSPIGAGLTMRNVQGNRASLETMEVQLAALEIPVLLVVGDEDDGCLDTNVFLKRTLPAAGLLVAPLTGHAVSQEEPTLFNDALNRFLQAIDRGDWRK